MLTEATFSQLCHVFEVTIKYTWYMYKCSQLTKGQEDEEPVSFFRHPVSFFSCEVKRCQRCPLRHWALEKTADFRIAQTELRKPFAFCRPTNKTLAACFVPDKCLGAFYIVVCRSCWTQQVLCYFAELVGFCVVDCGVCLRMSSIDAGSSCSSCFFLGMC